MAAASGESAQDYLPDARDLVSLADAAAGCRGCDLYRDAEQTVFGSGPASARMLLVGEQPGDREDRAGEPFVGPAGRLLDKALSAAAIDRGHVYLTNAVKHFKFTRASGSKRRIHKTPAGPRWWPAGRGCSPSCRRSEPEVVVLLGATAAKALLGNDFRLTEHRGEVLHAPEADYAVVATPHPSSVLVDRRSVAPPGSTIWSTISAPPRTARHGRAATLMAVRIGTSGWSYDHWSEVLYPPGSADGAAPRCSMPPSSTPSN